MGTLINPQRPSPQDAADFYPTPIYLRNPDTGVIFKLSHKDTVQRCLKERYEPSTEEAMRAQAVELAQLQGRPLPPWASDEAKAAEAQAERKPETDARVGDLMLNNQKPPAKR